MFAACVLIWQRRRDSNSRTGCPVSNLAGYRHKPLDHFSIMVSVDGFEPSVSALWGHNSATELYRQNGVDGGVRTHVSAVEAQGTAAIPHPHHYFFKRSITLVHLLIYYPYRGTSWIAPSHRSSCGWVFTSNLISINQSTPRGGWDFVLQRKAVGADFSRD